MHIYKYIHIFPLNYFYETQYKLTYEKTGLFFFLTIKKQKEVKSCDTLAD